MAIGASPESDAWDLIPERPTLHTLNEAAAGCRACRLWRNATQTVFGEGTQAAGRRGDRGVPPLAGHRDKGGEPAGDRVPGGDSRPSPPGSNLPADAPPWGVRRVPAGAAGDRNRPPLVDPPGPRRRLAPRRD